MNLLKLGETATVKTNFTKTTPIGQIMVPIGALVIIVSIDNQQPDMGSMEFLTPVPLAGLRENNICIDLDNTFCLLSPLSIPNLLGQPPRTLLQSSPLSAAPVPQTTTPSKLEAGDVIEFTFNSVEHPGYGLHKSSTLIKEDISHIPLSLSPEISKNSWGVVWPLSALSLSEQTNWLPDTIFIRIHHLCLALPDIPSLLHFGYTYKILGSVLFSRSSSNIASLVVVRNDLGYLPIHARPQTTMPPVQTPPVIPFPNPQQAIPNLLGQLQKGNTPPPTHNQPGRIYKLDFNLQPADKPRTTIKNNDGRTSCAWCGAPTKKQRLLLSVADICTKCGK